jgi:hypothetical protein
MFDLDPWEADPRWHPARREAFVTFRDMSERSYPKVARALAKSTTLIKRWAAEDGWQERVRAWDAEIDQRRREEFAAPRLTRRAQAETAARIRLVVDAFARYFMDELAVYRERGEDPFADLTPSQKLGAAARALQHAQQVERLARGVSTENAGGRAGEGLIPQDIERKSVEGSRPFCLDAETREATGSPAPGPVSLGIGPRAPWGA